MRQSNSTRLCCAVAIALLAPASGWAKAATVPPDRPNIVLVTLDTTRGDRLFAGLTPNLDHLAAGGIRFTDASTPIPFTLPAHATMLTGLYPREHGALRNGQNRLRDDAKSVVETLASAGYRTGAVVASFVLDHRTGLARGFDHYDDATSDAGGIEKSGKAVTAAAVEWLQSLDGDDPFFLWVHYFDAHAPYDPPADLLRATASSAKGLGERSPAMRRYDAEVASMDRQIGRLVYQMRRLGRLDRTAWIIVGDHGEAFGENGETGHGEQLYQTTLRIPLVLRPPGAMNVGPGAPREATLKSSQPVSLLDIAPTIASLAGLDGSTDLKGRDLLPIGSGAVLPTVSLFLEAPGSGGEGGTGLVGVRTARRKLIRGSGDSLVDPASDESTDLSAAEPKQHAELNRQLNRFLAAFAVTGAPLPRAPVDDESREKLEALGYLH